MNPAALLLSCVAMLNAATGQVTRTTGLCDTPLSPASTFKIPHALLALETGVVTAIGQLAVDSARHVFASAAWRPTGGVDNLEGTRAAERAFAEKGVVK